MFVAGVPAIFYQSPLLVLFWGTLVVPGGLCRSFSATLKNHSTQATNPTSWARVTCLLGVQIRSRSVTAVFPGPSLVIVQALSSVDAYSNLVGVRCTFEDASDPIDPFIGSIRELL